MFDVNLNIEQFKAHLRDFLITIKEFESEDNSVSCGLFGGLILIRFSCGVLICVFLDVFNVVNERVFVVIF